MSKATLAGWYNSSAWDEPEQVPSVRNILEAEDRFLAETIDAMEKADTQHDAFAGWDMSDLITRAELLDAEYRRLSRDDRRHKAEQRLCRIIAGKYTRAVIAGDIDECDRLAGALVLATRHWCNG